MTIDVPTAVGFAFVFAFASAHIRHTYLESKMKRVFVDELKCPKCSARPGVPCFFGEGWQCQERWDKAFKINAEREKLRDRAQNRRGEM